MAIAIRHMPHRAPASHLVRARVRARARIRARARARARVIGIGR